MAVSWDEIENAFLYVSMDQEFMHNAYLCKESGEAFYTSELGDSDELPEDIDDPKKYISIPHKNELNLGKDLVIEFTAEYLPEELEKVDSIFRRRGAYSRYKDLLESKGMIEDWFQFEEKRTSVALKEWCKENKIDLKD